MAIASLPMYDLEGLRDATDAWWKALARAFRDRGIGDVPANLERGSRHDHWSSPDLLLSQTCGYPLMNDYTGRLRLLATPVYEATHCRGTSYCSLVLVREGSAVAGLEGLRSLRVAVNGFDSHSGFNALRAIIAPLARQGRFFGDVIESGGHLESLRMVTGGTADVCAVDCLSFALWRDTIPEITAGARILAATDHAPNLPYVTAIGRGDAEVEALRQGLFDAARNPDLEAVRARLRIGGFEILPLEAYDRIHAFARLARDHGYQEIA